MRTSEVDREIVGVVSELPREGVMGAPRKGAIENEVGVNARDATIVLSSRRVARSRSRRMVVCGWCAFRFQATLTDSIREIGTPC